MRFCSFLCAARNNFYSRNNSYSSSSFKDLRQSNAHTVHPRKPRVRNGRPDSNWREDSVNRFDTTRNDSQGRFDNTRLVLQAALIIQEWIPQIALFYEK